MSVTSLMNRTCSIERWSDRTPDSDGIVRPTWTATTSGATSYALQEKGGQMMDPASGRIVDYDAVGYMAFGTDVVPGNGDAAKRDRIVDSTTGGVYYVEAVIDQTGREGFLKLLLRSV